MNDITNDDNVIQFPKRDRVWKGPHGETIIRTAAAAPESHDIVWTRTYPVERWFSLRWQAFKRLFRAEN